jgi:hypothetical protein
MAKNILKEAIADAKAVREVALANAKAALEEAFTPKLQSMLSAKLSEELDEDDDEDLDLDEMMTYDEDDDMEESMTYDEDEDITGMDEEIDLEEILSELELDEGDEEDMDEDMYDEDMDEDMYDEDMYEGPEEVNEDFNLDRLLEEINNLEERNPNVTGKFGQPATSGPKGMGGKVGSPPECQCTDGGCSQDCCPGPDCGCEGPDCGEPMGKHGPFEPGSPGYDMDIREGELNESFAALAGLVGLLSSAGVLTALEMATEDPEFKAKHPKATNALQKVFGFMRKVGKDVGSGIKEENDIYELNDELEETYNELNETKKSLKTVRNELNEVNLLNSKLLYVNRIFKANQLDEAQKLRVVETLDKAESVKEAKLIYETVKNTFTISTKKKMNSKRSIREGLGMASKASGEYKAPKKILNESNDMVSRMQKLANIKINQ